MQHYLKLSQETLYLAISLLDTILDKRDIEADKLQLVGIVLAFMLGLNLIDVDISSRLLETTPVYET